MRPAEDEEAEADPRWLQCHVNAEAPGVRPHTLVEGDNDVTVFVGPLEDGALAAGSLTDTELGFTRPGVTSVGLTAVLVPLEPRGEDCGPACGDGPDDTSIVCPAAFLGLRATIERHYVDAPGDGDDPGRQVLTTAAPTRRRRLAVTRAVLGASRKVTDADVRATLAELGEGTGRARTWQEWADLLAQADTDLLVLVPHTDVAAATLEISAQTLVRGRIEARHVTGGRPVHPVVVLLGCDTAGSADDPAGFATRFLARDAAVVVSSLTMLRASHAARLAQRLVAALREAAADRRREPLGDLVTAWRRAAVAEGLPAALALTAYGDADWTI